MLYLLKFMKRIERGTGKKKLIEVYTRDRWNEEGKEISSKIFILFLILDESYSSGVGGRSSKL